MWRRSHSCQSAALEEVLPNVLGRYLTSKLPGLISGTLLFLRMLMMTAASRGFIFLVYRDLVSVLISKQVRNTMCALSSTAISSSKVPTVCFFLCASRQYRKTLYRSFQRC
jgi:hypothetical protein